MKLERELFEIISFVGSARSYYIEAIQKAKENDFESSNLLIDRGNENFTKGHRIHLQLIQQDLDESQENLNITLLLIHAEDLLISTETIQIFAKEFISLYKKID